MGALGLCALFAWFSWSHAVVAATLSCDSSCQSAQRAGLIDLYSSTGGSGWLNKGFASITASTDFTTICTILTENRMGACCDSSQSACDITSGDIGVSALILAHMNLQGTLPTSFVTSMAPTLLCFIAVGKDKMTCQAICTCVFVSPEAWCSCRQRAHRAYP